MDLKKIESFQDKNRILVHVFDRRLSDLEYNSLNDILKNFTNTWKAHNDHLQGNFEIYHHQIVVLAVKKKMSGCSLDSSTRVFKTFTSIYGANALNNNLWFFINDQGKIQSVTKSEFAKLVEKGTIKDETMLIDPTITTVKELRKGGLKKPFKLSWHKKAFL